MKLALSIKQPWAWLIVNGYKDVENRTWYTKYRGELYIHSPKRMDFDSYSLIEINFPKIKLPQMFNLKYGGIVGKVRLIDCIEVHDSKWFTGPYGFVFKDPVIVPFIPYRGELGLFQIKIEELDDE